MKRLLILRHAKSSWADSDLDDHDRPLNARGRHDAPRMGRLLRDEHVVPDAIVSSTATRARETALAVAAETGFRGDVCLTRELYDEGPRGYLARIAATADEVERLMVVGHNPSVEELVTVLTGASETMPTAAIAVVDFAGDSWRDAGPGAGLLVTVWRPKELPDRPD
jgi:phosphohistidine phosphatase